MQSSPSNSIQTVGILCGLLAIIPSGLLERRRKRLGIGALPFAWAFFVGVSAFLFGSILGGAGFVAAMDSNDLSGAGIALAFGAAYALPGWFVIQRRRWAWVILTVLSLNPFSWIINYIYGRNRWSELSNAPFTRTSDATADAGPSSTLAELA